jgi:hypothetical protein
MFTQGIQFLQSHPWLIGSLVSAVLAVPGFLFNSVVTVLVSELPAPTKDSTQKYIYWFKVTNKIVGNWQRAKSTKLENSPNWQAAVEAHVQQLADSGLIIAPKPNGKP